MINVTCTIGIYEINSKDSDPLEEKLIIESHWNCEDRICLTINGKDEITVIANDLIEAIRNATNVNRY